MQNAECKMQNEGRGLNRRGRRPRRPVNAECGIRNAELRTRHSAAPMQNAKLRNEAQIVGRGLAPAEKAKCKVKDEEATKPSHLGKVDCEARRMRLRYANFFKTSSVTHIARDTLSRCDSVTLRLLHYQCNSPPKRRYATQGGRFETLCALHLVSPNPSIRALHSAFCICGFAALLPHPRRARI